MNNSKYLIPVSFIILILFILSLAVALFTVGSPIPANPLLHYYRYTAGQGLPDITHCDQYDFTMHGEGVYVFCPLHDGIVSRVVMASDWRQITYSYLYTDHLTYGDLVQWYGYPTNITKSRGWWAFRWNEIIAYTQHGASRYDTPIQMISLLRVAQ